MTTQTSSDAAEVTTENAERYKSLAPAVAARSADAFEKVAALLEKHPDANSAHVSYDIASEHVTPDGQRKIETGDTPLDVVVNTTEITDDLRAEAMTAAQYADMRASVNDDPNLPYESITLTVNE